MWYIQSLSEEMLRIYSPRSGLERMSSFMGGRRHEDASLCGASVVKLRDKSGETVEKAMLEGMLNMA